MLIRLCHTYNPIWAHMAKALLGAHGVEVNVVHEQAMHLYAPGSVMPCTLLVEEEDWADAVEILRAEPVAVDSAPVPPPLPARGVGEGFSAEAGDAGRMGGAADALETAKTEVEVESREHYFPDPMALLMSRILVGGVLGLVVIILAQLRTEPHASWSHGLGHDAAAKDFGFAINLLLGHVISTPLVLISVPVLIWLRRHLASAYRLDELRKMAAELEDGEK